MDFKEKITLKHRLIFTAIVTVLIGGNLIWNHFHDGVPSHHILDRKDLPKISNWWGILTVPLMTWFLLSRIAKRVNNDTSININKTIYNFLGAVLFGVLVSYFFTIGSPVPGYMLVGAIILSFFIPLYKAEFLLGFIIGMLYTFGGILPVAFGIIFITLFTIAYKVLRAGVVYLVTKLNILPLTLLLILAMSCANKSKSEHEQLSESKHTAQPENFISILETVWETEQTPLRKRDSLMAIYGADSEQYKKYQAIYEKNHIINEQKVSEILDTHGWPTLDKAGELGNWTICNVIQHADNEIRIKYLPMMRQAVLDKKLEPRFLVRAEDRIATERGDLQIYGGQMKYYPETKSFNVWPVFEPENIDKRRAEIGLGPIAEFLKIRFDFEWNLEEQIKRSEAFLLEKNK